MNGNIVILIGTIQDISEHKQAKEELQEVYKLYEDVQILSKLGGWKCDVASGRHTWTDEVYRIYGVGKDFDPSDVQKCISFYAPESIPTISNAYNRSISLGESFEVEVQFIRFNGERLWVRVTGNPIVKEGKVQQVTGYLVDISDTKSAEEDRLSLERQLLHSQKLESLGVLSGGIAHDFNNLLQAILGNLDLAQNRIPEGVIIHTNLERAINAARHAAKLTSMMLAYSGKGSFIVKRLNLTELVEENAAMLSAAIGKSVSLALQLDHSLPSVMADTGQIQQVVMNLITNASEAIGEENGTITLATGMRKFDQSTLNRSRLVEKMNTGRFVWLEVTDTGCGMDEETQQKLFDPFFTTKFTGRGLGMSAVLGIIRSHKGAFFVESQPGSGTTMMVVLPLANPLEAQLTPDNVSTTIYSEETGQSLGVVLIVDDEEMVRGVSADMFEEFGFETMVASDGEQAINLFRNHSKRIDLVLLDQSMPGMDGVAVFHELRKIKPEIRVLLASGFSEEEVSKRFNGLGLDGFIQKPFNLEKLSGEVQRIITS
jgi:signal transduction histidine kinase/CheY-like chemotaxis protein